MRTLYLFAVWVHLLAAMTWIGGMAVVAAAVMPEVRRLDEPVRSRFLWHFFGRFRVVMWSAFAVTGAAGGVCLWLRGMRWADFVDPAWLGGPFGSALALKIALFLLSGIIVLLHERTRAPRRARRLGQAGFGLGLAIVLLAVVLVRGW